MTAIIRIKCGTEFHTLTVDTGKDSLFHEHATPIPTNLEYEIADTSMMSLTAILSAINGKIFADMLILMFSTEEAIRKMTGFEIMYVCAKMNLLREDVRTMAARKYIYRGLMDEALSLKNESMKIIPTKKILADETGDSDQVCDDTAFEVQKEAEYPCEWASAKRTKKKKGKRTDRPAEKPALYGADYGEIKACDAREESGYYENGLRVSFI
ncbi:hypothetical protein CDD83_4377 [Cordyceps sp. RAO-2017]|nr:hypothetical protein CDD83_4377 [Cordyceps sp. RAO-2017]